MTPTPSTAREALAQAIIVLGPYSVRCGVCGAVSYASFGLAHRDDCWAAQAEKVIRDHYQRGYDHERP